MDELRYGRLEQRVDEIKDNVAELKSESKVHHIQLDNLRINIEEYRKVIEAHVTGDQKIINHITPVMPELKAMLEEFNLKKLEKQQRDERYKYIGMRIGIFASLCSGLAAFWKLFEYLK